MARGTEAYVDTSALIAFVDQSDSYHPLFRRLFAKPPRLITTPLVVAEGHGWFLRRYDVSRGLWFLAMIEAIEPLQVLPLDKRDQVGAVEVLRRFSDQRLTMVDSLGLHIMRERGSSSCWSTDRHLGLTGVPLAIDTH